ncbi:helix-turn-helix domain-containing protein [Brachybacterium sp. DNPG3]
MTAARTDGAGLGAWRREPRTVVLEAAGLPEDAPAAFVIHAEKHSADVPTEFPEHTHPLHELVWVRGGTMSARVGERLLTVPEGRGLWLPAGTAHAGRLTADVELCDAFFAVEDPPPGLEEARVLEMDEVLESLLLRLTRTDLDAGARSRTEAVVMDVLVPSADPLELRVPADPRIAPIAEALLADPADPRDLEHWARELRLGERTITRAFRQSTGLTFGRWRQMLRVHQALQLLGEGESVQEVALLLGYGRPSTFIAAFSRVMGTTPGAFAARR